MLLFELNTTVSLNGAEIHPFSDVSVRVTICCPAVNTYSNESPFPLVTPFTFHSCPVI